MFQPIKFASLLAAFAILEVASAQSQIIVSDTYNLSGNGTGFALDQGVNSGINPPTTRLTGAAAGNLRYISTANPTKASTAFNITSNKLRVTAAANAGRFTLSSDGTTPFNFASALGATNATPQNPVVYDIGISMANSSANSYRCSFALATAEGDATTWDFGVQLFRTDETDNFYTIGKRIDTTASGLASDLNIYITNTVPGTYGTEINLLMHVTDAGSETTTFNSRMQLSTDGGLTWFYDTETDSSLPSGWRLNGAGRYILWDVAPDAGIVTYDNFSVRPIPVAANLVSPANNASGLGASANLIALVSNTAPGNVTVTFFGREAPEPGPGPDFLIPVLPDTQNYAREAAGSGDATKEMWFAQTDWIITNRVQQNIAYVATLGDCVQNGNDASEWKNATNAYYRLEKQSTTLLAEGIPYGVTVGNHDQDPNGDLDGSTSSYNQYFGISHFNGKSYYGGNYDANNDSWYDLFSAGGMDFIVFSFEYGRYGSFVLDWANDVLATNQNRRIIVLTHHAGDDNSDVNATTTPFSAQGQALYDGLKANPNFFLMLGGHVFNEGGEGRRSDTFNGKTVRTLVSDYQGRFNGGNGLMRLMYFSPSNNLVSVKTYSPYTGAYETDANSQFSFTYNMQPNGAGSPGTAYVARGTNFNVVPGSQSSFVWTGLQANKTYEWYVTVTDSSGNSIISSSRKFTKTGNTAPVGSNQTVTVTGDQPTQLTLKGSDSNGDALTFTTNSAPSHGVLTNFNPSDGTVTYQPTTGYRGSDSFLFRVTDSVATSGNATVTLNVVTPPVPVIVAQPNDAVVNEYSNVIFSVSATGSNLFYQWYFGGQPIGGATASAFFIANVRNTNQGSYFVAVTNTGGATNSRVASLTVIPAPSPVIVAQPNDAVVNEHSNVMFTVSATGPALFYQWHYGGQPVEGATASTFFITNVRTTNQGSYFVSIINTNGATNSRTAILTVIPASPPLIVVQPDDVVVNEHSNATFSVSATGSGLSYQWYFGGQPIDNATASTLLITDARLTNEGSYFVSVTNSDGATNSRTATLTVTPTSLPPVIVTQPLSKSVNQGSNVTFSVVATGTNLVYQWYFASQPLSAATDSTLLITNARQVNVGSYYVAITNSGGATNSVAVNLVVVSDSLRPTISVSTPGKGKGFNQPSINLAGFAKDSGAGNSGIIQSVSYSLNEGATNDAAISNLGAGTWSFVSTSPLLLTPGTNFLSIWASDFAGNRTNVVIPFFYDLTNTLTLHISNNGKVKMGITNWSGATTVVSNFFKVGRPYKFDAFVDAGVNCIFTNWVTWPMDRGTSTNVWVQKSSLSFVMQENMVITANFLTNPFTAVAGGYNGLFSDTNNGVAHETAGFIQLKVKEKSAYSGLLFFDGNKISFSGKFNTDGTATREVLRSKVPGNKPPVTLSLALEMSPGGESLTGTLSATNGEWTSQIIADKGVFNDKSLPYDLNTNYDGNFTIQIPPGFGAPTNSPGGFGYGAISNSPGGFVKLTGALSDGAKLTQKMNISRGGQWPLYVGLYKNSLGELKGALMGWVTFSTNGGFGPSSDNVITWIKKGGSESTTRYPNGFTNFVELAGSPYFAPDDLENPIRLNTGYVEIRDGNLFVPFTNVMLSVTSKKVTLSPRNLTGGLNNITLTFTKKNGLFTGNFLNPTAKTNFYGVLLQNTTNASGYFLGPNQSGSVKVTK